MYYEDETKKALIHKDPETGIQAEYFEVLADTNYLEVISVLASAASYTSWVPLVSESNLITQLTPFRKV